MSIHTRSKRLTVPQLVAMKGQQKIVSLTAYTSHMARLMDPFVDFVLIGDSTAMVGYGRTSTLDMSLEEIIGHTRAVVASTRLACVIADMPFGSYQESPQQAYRNCAEVLARTGCDALKLEGGRALAPTVEFLVQRGIPLMAHIGLMPQYVNVMGGFKAQGLNDGTAQAIEADARAHLEAGAFSLLLEGVAENLARRISDFSPMPTIGIGASPACDGQVLVTEDLLGLGGPQVPRFVKQYADVGALISQACEQFAAEVRDGRFPEARHCYGV
ncbi:3-methyl-2-oxobutanoate hydroxymethyltransferase 1 [Pseudomonas chlororaphis subsp. aurantiaca]|uniref:3-methyl-2-oxobutanoate hydroxymethyltransferase n=1 Tax=Pseudomonas chlororaphis TaxID=587753 RepID=UPI000864C537|nr:3-methyl-2-oxobutanoate hydroxymethyltransferase [Pseudomonas chlororaphis]AZD24493.1 3-methyl-2-oxobutanoate hydroxymethyltransferase [Pseudomonas chlororaphis subsp. aurantiaca]AZD50783.1 3-methyl-2-oxobutanoate hydroxymethyltransferase [Pseudomonas chlororaphis subsp. aurantiaca]AZD57043.1 3-methyl-2-oxobutanoate hydroxymethyltransferase [Pseudomonas chlororaphis subsp. aurantiaca]AZD63011.1 3-methyl-2-oxobutanoate hydroxymethyltransferase [Pseudomonas chlororaphis subsp. aurantiaca]AZD7